MLFRFWIPLTFVFLFASGFIAARFGVQDADPFMLLLVRSIITLPLLAGIILLRSKRQNWGSAKGRINQMIVGSLLHGAYLGGVFAAIQAGLSAGITALLVSMHPLFTAGLSGPLFGVKLNTKQWFGLALGAGGAVLVLGSGLATSGTEHSLSAIGLVWCLISLLGISSSTLLQKRVGQQMGLVEGLVYQYIGALIVFLVAVLITNGFVFDPTARLLLTLGWLVIAISIGAIWLLMLMLERGEAHQVARLFFLVPPCAALMAWVLFDEQWTLPMVLGASLIVVGLAMDSGRSK